jgi:hypothetical protein
MTDMKTTAGPAVDDPLPHTTYLVSLSRATSNKSQQQYQKGCVGWQYHGQGKSSMM